MTERRQPRSTLSGLGTSFAEALARKDFDEIRALMHPEVDFRGLTPGKLWQASNPRAVIDDVLRFWFEDSDEVEELLHVETGPFADRQHLAYSLRGHNPDGPFIVQQQAYFKERDGRIAWMRVLCSGFCIEQS